MMRNVHDRLLFCQHLKRDAKMMLAREAMSPLARQPKKLAKLT